MRKISRLTQSEFAKHRGISVQALKQIEAGTANPTVATLERIADIFGLKIGFVPSKNWGQIPIKSRRLPRAVWSKLARFEKLRQNCATPYFKLRQHHRALYH